jgi:hypothetical protein
MGASDRAHFFIAYDRLLDLTFFHAGSSGSRQISPLRPPDIHHKFIVHSSPRSNSGCTTIGA